MRSQPSSNVNEQAPPGEAHGGTWVIRAAGLGLITGAADDDPSAIGTYASAGAKFGPAFLWVAPVVFPMLFAVVYLSAKVGQVSGRGLFAVLRKHYPRGLLYSALIGVVIGNTIEAGADLGGMAAAINLFIPAPIPVLVMLLAASILALQIWGSYVLLRNVFRLLSLALLAYVPAAILAKPELIPMLKATLIPTIRLEKPFLMMLVAIIGTTLSAYLYTWQSNEEVEDEKAGGRISLAQRRGATEREVRHSRAMCCSACSSRMWRSTSSSWPRLQRCSGRERTISTRQPTPLKLSGLWPAAPPRSYSLPG